MSRRKSGAGLAPSIDELAEEPSSTAPRSSMCRCGRGRGPDAVFCPVCLAQYAPLWAPITGPAKFGPVREGD